MTPELIGLTLDYDMFLLTRIRELRLEGTGTEAATREALDSTMCTISMAGAMMAIAFSGMLFSSLPLLRQIGFLLVIGTLLDTWVMRPIVVPACIMLGNPEWTWWPKQMPPLRRGVE